MSCSAPFPCLFSPSTSTSTVFFLSLFLSVCLNSTFLIPNFFSPSGGSSSFGLLLFELVYLRYLCRSFSLWMECRPVMGTCTTNTHTYTHTIVQLACIRGLPPESRFLHTRIRAILTCNILDLRRLLIFTW